MTKKRVLIYILLVLALLILITIILLFTLPNNQNQDNMEISQELTDDQLIEGYLSYCEQLDTEKLEDDVQECKAFAMGDENGCSSLKEDQLLRCKESIKNFEAFSKKISSLACSSLDADVHWCEAIKNNDINKCDEISDEKSLVFCKAKVSKDTSFCNQMNPQQECTDIYLFQKAFLDQNTTICDNIMAFDLKQACVLAIDNKNEIQNVNYLLMERKMYVIYVALALRNEKLCSYLEESDAKAICLSLVNSNREECNKALNIDYCYQYYDNYNSKFNLCDNSACVAQIINISSY